MPRPYMGMTNFVLKMTGSAVGALFFLKAIHKNDHPIWGGRYIFLVIHTGFEPVTSSLSRKRSKPAELMDQ